MPYFFGTAVQATTNGSGSTDQFLLNLKTIAGCRASLQKLIAGVFVTPADNQIRLRVQRTTTLLTASSGVTPTPMAADGPAANATLFTTLSSGALSAVPLVQLGFNQRGTAMWAAFTPDEAITVIGATAPNGEIVVNSQASAASIPVDLTLIHSE